MSGEDMKSIQETILDNPSFKDLSQEEIDEEIVSYTQWYLLYDLGSLFQTHPRWTGDKGN